MSTNMDSLHTESLKRNRERNSVI
uniref:Uncharacterized protein n=1 Tax=Arundo donax TaxID=35708 RepID=A0A0A9GQ94_ARUDO